MGCGAYFRYEAPRNPNPEPNSDPVYCNIESIVFFSTFWRVVVHNKSFGGNTNSLLNLILLDGKNFTHLWYLEVVYSQSLIGVIYFGVIFIANLVTVLTLIVSSFIPL